MSSGTRRHVTVGPSTYVLFPLRPCAFAPLLLLFLALLSPCPLPAQADDERPPDEPAAARAPALSEDELEKRYEALEGWTYEPVAIDTANYRFLMDRRNSRFVLRDLRSDMKWYSSWGREGFASILLETESGGVRSSEWIALDQVRKLVAEASRIRFSVGPTRRDTPAVDFVFEALPGGGGLRLRYEVPPKSRESIRAVRLLDEGLWVSDADRGAIVLPRGLGEQLEADVHEPARRRLHGTPLFRPAGDPDSEAASLSCVGLLSGESALLVRWFETFVAVEAERKPIEDPEFPGTSGVFLSIESAHEQGEIEVYSLGKIELAGVDVTRAYREVLAEENPATLRYKTGAMPRHRSFVGAALFRPAIGRGEEARSSFEDVTKLAANLKDRLDIDRAAFVLRDALRLRPGDEDRRSALARPVEAGGDEGLLDCARRLHELGHLVGVEVPLSLLDEQAAALDGGQEDGSRAERPDARDASDAHSSFVGPRLGEEAETWVRRARLLDEAGPLSDLREAFELDLLFTREEPVELGEYEASPVIAMRSAFYERVFGAGALVGVSPGTELDVGKGVYLGGFFRHAGTDWPPATFFPLLPAAFGHCVRFGRPPTAPLEADDPKGVLFHLLLGEVPLYATPRASRAWSQPARDRDDPDPAWVFARDAGWAEGRGLSAYEVFLRNTYEVLSHVARYRSRSMMLFHRRLSPDGGVRETYFGQDMRIVVNAGASDYEDEEDRFVLPPNGFYVRYPFLLAFHALRVNDHSYEAPVFYVVRSLEGKMIYRAENVSIYRGFGPSTLYLGGKRYDVPGRIVTKLW